MLLVRYGGAAVPMSNLKRGSQVNISAGLPPRIPPGFPCCSATSVIESGNRRMAWSPGSAGRGASSFPSRPSWTAYLVVCLEASFPSILPAVPAGLRTS